MLLSYKKALHDEWSHQKSLSEASQGHTDDTSSEHGSHTKAPLPRAHTWGASAGPESPASRLPGCALRRRKDRQTDSGPPCPPRLRSWEGTHATRPLTAHAAPILYYSPEQIVGHDTNAQAAEYFSLESHSQRSLGSPWLLQSLRATVRGYQCTTGLFFSLLATSDPDSACWNSAGEV